MFHSRILDGAGVKAFNISSIRTVSVCREALTDARYEAEQRQGDAGGAAMVTKARATCNDILV